MFQLTKSNKCLEKDSTMISVVHGIMTSLRNYRYINGFREKMYKTQKMYFFMLYNFYLKYFSKFSLFTKINGKNHDFMGFFITFVISASKYVSIRSSKGIGGQTYPELYPSNQINFCRKSNKLYLWRYINALICLFWRKINLIQINIYFVQSYCVWIEQILFHLNKSFLWIKESRSKKIIFFDSIKSFFWVHEFWEF